MRSLSSKPTIMLGALVAAGFLFLPAVTLACGAVDLEIIKTGPASSTPGSTITYTVTLKQLASGTPTQIVLIDNFPVGLSFLPALSSPECTLTNNKVTCSMSNLGLGAKQKTLTLSFSVPSDSSICGPIVNFATVTAKENDLNNSNNFSSSTTTILCVTPTPTPTPTVTPTPSPTPSVSPTPTPTPSPTPTPTPSVTPSPTPTPTPTPSLSKSLRIRKSDGGRDITRPGHTFAYRLEVTNTGEQTLGDVTVRDPIPGALAISSVSGGGSISGQTVTWKDLNLGSGETRSFVINVRVRDAASNGRICNNAEARSDDHGLRDTSEDCITIQRPGVVVAAVPIPVAVSARTGPGAMAMAITLFGAIGFGLVRRGL